MKTTLEIPDELFRRTKAEAAMNGRSMKELVIEALQERLKRAPRRAAGWRKVYGRASKEMVRDVEERLRDLERVGLEDWR